MLYFPLIHHSLLSNEVAMVLSNISYAQKVKDHYEKTGA